MNCGEIKEENMMAYLENFPEIRCLMDSIPDNKREEKMSEEIDYILFKDIPIKKLVADNLKIDLRNYLCKAKMSDRFYLFTRINWEKVEFFKLKEQILQD